MTKRFTVHIYPIVRVVVKGVEADDQVEAIKKAEEMVDLHSLLDRDGVEYAEDVDGYLVDEEGDEDFKNSRSYDKNYRPL